MAWKLFHIATTLYVVLILKFRSGFDTEPVGITNSELVDSSKVQQCNIWIIDERFI